MRFRLRILFTFIDSSIFKLHQVVLFLMISFVTFMIIGCGLPDYGVLSRPTVINQGTSTTLLGFTTPVDDDFILGYTLYYKIYISLSEYSTFNDEQYFLDGYYLNTNDEFPTGNIVPLNHGFVRAGVFGQDDIPNYAYNIPHKNDVPGPNDWVEEDIFIDFNIPPVGDSNLREEPVVILDTLPGVTVTPNITLARGFLDLRYTEKYLRRFVDDWYVSPEEPPPYNIGFFDGDLRRPPPSSQPGLVGDIWTGTPIIFDTGGEISSDFIIAFVVYSTGVDTTGGEIRFLDSKPIHLGKIVYSQIRVNLTRSSE